MQNAPCVRRGQRLTQLTPDVGDLFRWQPADALDERGEIFALHELHRQEYLPLLLADVEYAAHGRMRDLPRKTNLVQKQTPRFRAGRAHQLERDRNSEHEIVGAPDISHAAVAQMRHHPVAAGEHLARREQLRRGIEGRRLAVSTVVLVVRGEQRLDVDPQLRVVAAGRLDELLALGRRTAQRREKKLFRASVGWRHDRSSLLADSRFGTMRIASQQSCVNVRRF